MPPKRTTKAAAAAAQPTQIHGRIGVGAGITAGLEIWAMEVAGKHRFTLVDRSADGRFATDVTTWNTAAGLNEVATKILKDAT
jgi:hypothetical protein